jgi:glycerol kinase
MVQWPNSTKLQDKVHHKTGLRIDPYFSAGKLVWLLENVDGLRALAEQGHVALERSIVG